MSVLVLLILTAVAVAAPSSATAVSLTGVLVHSCDDFGNPSGYDWDGGQLATGVLWRTAVHTHWFGLGLLNGLPPESLQTQWLNAPDFTLNFPLSSGENNFTLVAEPGGGAGGDFQRFALNLYFDGAPELPSLSVLLPPKDAPLLSPPAPNRADVFLTFAVEPVRLARDAEIRPDSSYHDEQVTVSVIAANFGWLGKFPVPDLISGGGLTPNGTGDVVGFMTILVEETAAPAPVVGVGPGAFGVVPGGAPPPANPGPAHGGPAIAGVPGQNPAPRPDLQWHAAPQVAPTPAAPAYVTPGLDETPGVDGTVSPSPETPTPGRTGGATPTAKATPRTAAPTAQPTADATAPTAKATAASGTRTVPATTPTAGARTTPS